MTMVMLVTICAILMRRYVFITCNLFQEYSYFLTHSTVTAPKINHENNNDVVELHKI